MIFFRLSLGKPRPPKTDPTVIEMITDAIHAYVWPPEVLLVDTPRRAFAKDALICPVVYQQLDRTYIYREIWWNASAMREHRLPEMFLTRIEHEVALEVVEKLEALTAVMRKHHSPLVTRETWRCCA